MRRKEPDKGLQLAIEAAGGLRALARALDITPQAIMSWGQVPDKRIVQIERATKVQREKLRPDLYRKC